MGNRDRRLVRSRLPPEGHNLSWAPSPLVMLVSLKSLCSRLIDHLNWYTETMLLRMATAWKHPDRGIFCVRHASRPMCWLRRRAGQLKLPKDAAEGGIRLGPSARHAKASLWTRDPREAKALNAAPLVHLATFWQSLRDGFAASTTSKSSPSQATSAVAPLPSWRTIPAEIWCGSLSCPQIGRKRYLSSRPRSAIPLLSISWLRPPLRGFVL
jgi:hypothetical protein